MGWFVGKDGDPAGLDCPFIPKLLLQLYIFGALVGLGSFNDEVVGVGGVGYCCSSLKDQFSCGELEAESGVKSDSSA